MRLTPSWLTRYFAPDKILFIKPHGQNVTWRALFISPWLIVRTIYQSFYARLYAICGLVRSECDLLDTLVAVLDDLVVAAIIGVFNRVDNGFNKLVQFICADYSKYTVY